jgi:hypothetical protein
LSDLKEKSKPNYKPKLKQKNQIKKPGGKHTKSDSLFESENWKPGLRWQVFTDQMRGQRQDLVILTGQTGAILPVACISKPKLIPQPLKNRGREE